MLFVPEKREDEANWSWGSGRERKREEEEEGAVQRAANRAAVTSGIDDAAAYALAAQAQAAALREAKREEQARLKAEKKFSWNEKEKRKRAEGKVSRGSNYVEEVRRRQVGASRPAGREAAACPPRWLARWACADCRSLTPPLLPPCRRSDEPVNLAFSLGLINVLSICIFGEPGSVSVANLGFGYQKPGEAGSCEGCKMQLLT